MVELTARQIGWLNDELGGVVTTDELQEVFDRVGSVRETAITFVRRRITALSDQPLTVGISGVANFSFAENIKALERQISRLVKMDPDPSDDPGTDDGDRDDVVPEVQIRQLPRRRRRR